ncbi:MAG: hypothetical protein JO103_01895 [Candidatus Eremiobacteraeota bacterium]|nr:hypothetical protein [Candidatus Eremiobacteraeota bacterium]MBV9408047.1 hypothetical protein [Candidatus Eremiobacteraeota bacterium]
MKRLIACASLVAAATTAAVPATTSHPTTAHKTASHAKSKTVARAKCKVAPADEYFGKLKMSILGIRNTIKDQGTKVDVDPDRASTTFNAIALTEDAMHDWEHKYPCDSWIPGTIYALQHFYGKIHTEDGVKHVHAVFAWLRHDYPRASVVRVAMQENGAASASPPLAAANSGSSPEGGAASPSPVPAALAPTGPVGVTATPMPGLAPASVINAQNAMGASPAPSPAPHH